jgi:hypothetical protein
MSFDPLFDPINPHHYHGERKIEPIEVIEDWQLNFNLGNALKYIARNGRKPGENSNEGLLKAIWYLNRQINFNRFSNDYIGQAEWDDFNSCADG